MRNAPLIISLGLLGLSLPALGQAKLRYERPINIITSNYDLVDTTYIDRGRLDGVKVGDKFEVKFRDGKLATQVVVTGVFERMASVKILDSWLLKDGQVAGFQQRPMVVALQPTARRPAPDIKISPAKTAPAAKTAAPAPPAPAPAAPAAPAAPPLETPGMIMPPAAPGGEPGLPGMDAGGLPPTPGDPMTGDPMGGGLPPMPGDAGGLPPMPGDPMGSGLPPAPGDPMGGVPPPPMPAGDMGGFDIPPPPM